MPITVGTYERLAERMLRVYSDAEMDMTKRIAEHALDGSTDMQWSRRKLSEVRKVNKELRNTVQKLTKDRKTLEKEIVSKAYNGGVRAFKTDAEKFTDAVNITHVSPNAQKVARILNDLDETMDAADRTILRQANDVYADIIGEVSARVATGSTTVKEAVVDELNRFADAGITSFVDKAGRNWEMATYAEMATLTAIERATVEGYTDTMKEYGFDLAMISNHAGACPLCVAWEGVVVSISGESKEYPSLEQAESEGLFHPRCLHFISTYYEGISHGAALKHPRPVEQPSKAYSTRQKQRGYERQVRKWTRRMSVASSPEDERKCFAYIQMYRGRIIELIKNYNDSTPRDYDWLPRKRDREGATVFLSDAAGKLKPVTLNY